MNLDKKKDLLQKGWKDSEVRHAEKILDRASHHDLFFSKIVFWSALLVIIFANVIVSVVLIPFLVVLNKWFLYGVVALLALVIGFLYNFLITDIGLLEKKHHRTASVIVPIIALVNVVAMVLLSNRFIENLNIVQNNTHNVWLLAATFGVAFIIPYIISEAMKLSKS